MAENQELLTAIEAVKEAPQESSHWDRVEELVDSVQRPTDVSALFRDVLKQDLSSALATDIGQRAVRFYESWYGEDSTELPETLERVLEIDPQADWAFQRLTVAYTVAERWDALLAAYDKAIVHADQTVRRMQLLEDAAQAAKDFAAAPDRAIDYMTQLLALEPTNVTLGATLERLLERQGRFADLVKLYESRIAVLAAPEARVVRVRMASVYLERLSAPPQALAQARAVLDEAPADAGALSVLEDILRADAADAESRADALRMLKQHHLAHDAAQSVVAVLEISLQFVTGDDRVSTLRELVERLTGSDDERAMGHQADLLQLVPAPAEREVLLSLAHQTQDFECYQAALLQAAVGMSGESGLEFRLEAGRVLEVDLGDPGRAVEIYQSVFQSDVSSLALTAGRRVVALLEGTERTQETLEACARLSGLEQDEAIRRRLLGQVARLAESVGDDDRARAAWQACVGEDTEDVEAIDALMRSAEEREDWPRLAELIAMRIKAPAAAESRRGDLRRLALLRAEHLQDLDGAISAWQELQTQFGEDAESVNALAELLSRAERWEELAQHLQLAASREVARFTELQGDLGDAYRLRLERPTEAASRYRTALQVDPHSTVARAGLTALLEVPECVTIAAQALSAAYVETDEWQLRLSLVDALLAGAQSDEQRAGLLAAAAVVYEQRGDDPAAALSCLRRAFTLTPDDRAVEREIRRLAERLSAWDAVVQTYRETIASFVRPTARVGELRFYEAEVLESKVGDKQGALVACQLAAEVVPDRLEFADAVIRLAGQLDRPADVASQLIAWAQAVGAMDDTLLERVSSVTADSPQWAGIADAMMERLADAQLPSPLKRELYCWVATIRRDHQADMATAEAALLQASIAEPGHVHTLSLLATVQRQSPGTPLIDTLLKIADQDVTNLDPVHEACEIADEHAGSAPVMPILKRLFDASAALFKHQAEASGERDCQSMVSWALERLVQQHRAVGNDEAALALLSEGARLPFDAEAVHGLLHEAAQLAAEGTQDSLRATQIYRDILQLDPRDVVAMTRLGELYRAADRLPELLMLRRHELSQGPDAERALALRLEIAAVLGEMEERGGRVQSLEDNLDQSPGHRASLDALSAVLRGKGQFAELAVLMEVQSKALARSGAAERAAELLGDLASIQEMDLGDPAAAIETYKGLYELQPAGEATAALARLYGQQGAHEEAASWLEIRLTAAALEARAPIALALAGAHIAAGHKDRACGCLQQLLSQQSWDLPARNMLAQLYREDGQHGPLAELLEETAENVGDEAEQLRLLSEVAQLYCGPLGTPERAAPVLMRARQLAPQDDRLGAQLAGALRVAKRYDEAASVLQELIGRYGRKRSAERAQLHYQLACVLSAGGDRDSAIAELDTATKMDLAHAAALHMLARLCRKSGDLDRAERAFRGLLMLVRRQESTDIAEAGPSEVFYELYGIAKERGQDEQAEELMRSALEMSSQSDVEAARLQRVLIEHGDAERALGVIESRLKAAESDADVAGLWESKAEVLEANLGRMDDGLAARLQALQLRPDSDGLHLAARKSARTCGAVPRYLEVVTKLADAAAGDAAGDKRSAQLQLRVGRSVEEDLEDLDRAAAIYGRVEESGQCVVQAWLALARVAGARGETGEQRRVLQRIGELSDADASADARSDAMFMLAELGISSGEDASENASHIDAALRHHADYGRASRLLRALLSTSGQNEPALALLRTVARNSGDDALLLDWHMRVSDTDDADFDCVREGVALALRMSQDEHAETLLRRAEALAKARDLSGHSWIYAGLAECRVQAGDVQGAVSCLRSAVAQSADEEAHQLRRELAKVAEQPGGDLAVAAEAYEAMLEREPGNRELWEPLAAVYGALADRDAMAGFVGRTLPGLLSPEDRCDLQMIQARFIIDKSDADLEAVGPLQAIVEEVPGHREATEMLTDIFQRHQMVDDLAALLQRQFDRVRDQQDLPGIVDVASRIGALYPADRPEDAIDVYRAALEWVPEEPRLLRALLERFDDSTDVRDRAEAMHSLLKSEQGEAAARLAAEVVELWAELLDDERIQQALELGLRACPTDSALKQRLESFYAERDMWGPLAELMIREAAAQQVPEEAVVIYKNAASLFRDRMGDSEGAARALRAALELAPADVSLLAEHCRNLAAAGNADQAIEDVAGLLERHCEADQGRIDLLRVRADLLKSAERHQDAVADLEAAYAIDPTALTAELVDALDVLKGQAFLLGDREMERTAALRLVELHDAAGAADSARQVLAQWCEAEQEDLEAHRALRRRDEGAERYQEVAQTCRRLIELEEGEAKVEAALGLADACDRTGEPDMARDGLERVYREIPDNGLLRERLRQLYESLGENRELAEILLAQADDTQAETSDRIALYQRVAQLLIAIDDPEAALAPLKLAGELAPEDRNNELLMIDILLKLERLEDAKTMLEQAIDSHKRKRSPELAQLQLRMGRLCAVLGDVPVQLQWLQQAIDTDRKSGEVAGELVEVAMAVQDYDGAMKALRNITMMEDPKPITRAMAFFKQAQIAVIKGDTRRAQHWARKAKSLDGSLIEVDTLLAELDA